jgi:cell shape-determining protein MreD
MIWGAFAIGLLVIYLVQTALQPLLPAWLDLFVAYALFCGLLAPLYEARLFGWITGLLRDVNTQGPIGVHALALGLAGLLLTHLRELANAEVWWVRWLIGFVAALPGLLGQRLYFWFDPAVHVSLLALLWETIVTAFVASLLAALATTLPALLYRRRRYSVARW